MHFIFLEWFGQCWVALFLSSIRFLLGFGQQMKKKTFGDSKSFIPFSRCKINILKNIEHFFMLINSRKVAKHAELDLFFQVACEL